jgi:hypothetical protein
MSTHFAIVTTLRQTYAQLPGLRHSSKTFNAPTTSIVTKPNRNQDSSLLPFIVLPCLSKILSTFHGSRSMAATRVAWNVVQHSRANRSGVCAQPLARRVV